jgi:hypothetical protein
LRNVQPLGSLTETAELGHVNEGSELPDIHAVTRSKFYSWLSTIIFVI